MELTRKAGHPAALHTSLLVETFATTPRNLLPHVVSPSCPKGCIRVFLLPGSPGLTWDVVPANLVPYPSKLALQAQVLLTHSGVMGIKASEAFLVGEVRPEGEPHVGPWGQDHLLSWSLLCVRCLPATEGCQLLVLSFNLLAERRGEPGEPAVCSLGRPGWDWNHPLYPLPVLSQAVPGLASVSMGHRDSGLPVLPGGTSETDDKSRWHPGYREELGVQGEDAGWEPMWQVG